MTGISRKEVQRLKSSAFELPLDDPSPLSPLADLLHVWATTSEYLDSAGKPLLLFSGNAGKPSFDDLVRACMGDVPPGAVKRELVRLGAIQAAGELQLRLVRRSLIPDDAATRLESAFLYSLRSLAETIAHNTDPRIPESQRHFERFVESRPLSEREIELLQIGLKKLLVGVTEQIDTLLSDGETKDAASIGRRVGVGIFYNDRG